MQASRTALPLLADPVLILCFSLLYDCVPFLVPCFPKMSLLALSPGSQNCFTLFFFFKLELYNIVFVSAVLSWVCFMYTHNPSLLDRPQPPAQPQVITKHRAKLPGLYSRVAQVIFLFYSILFWPCCVACWRILVPQPGMKQALPAVEAQNLNLWATRDVPK